MAARPRPFTIDAIGPFDLRQGIAFLEGWPPTAAQRQGPAVLRFATVSESDGEPFAVRVEAVAGGVSAAGGVRVETVARGVAAAGGVSVRPSRTLDAATRRQVARALSLDVDATAYPALGEADEVVGRLQRERPGLRPVCFWSVWEAAIWAVLTQRSSRVQSAALTRRLAEQHGAAIDVDGVVVHAFPAPEVVIDLLGGSGLPGVPEYKQRWIADLARAVLEGTLTGEHLRSMPAADASEELRRLPGLGPFSAGLVTIRGAGHPDHFTIHEPRLVARIRDEYRLGPDADPTPIAEQWRPFRSWVGFLLRTTG